MSSNASSDSEGEFWEELEQPPVLSVKAQSSPRFVQKAFKTVQFDQFKSQLSEFLPEGHQRERLYTVLDQVREAAKEAHEISMTLALKELHKSYKRKIHDLSEKNRLLVEELRIDYEKLTLSLTQKDNEIARVQRLLTDQEEFISRHRITKETLTKPVVIEKEAQMTEKGEKLKGLKLQIESFRKLVHMYQEQTIDAQEKLANTEALLKQREQEFATQIAELNQNAQKLTQDYELQMQQFRTQFDNYKDEAQKELEVCHLVNARQTELVKMLQNELRSAKIVLQAPRLKFKYEKRMNTKSVDLRSQPRPKKLSPLRKWLNRGTKVWKPKMARASPEIVSTRESPGFSSPENYSLPSVNAK